MSKSRTLLVTKGHPFEKGPFFDWIEGVEALDVTHVEHPAAEAFIGAGLGADYDLWLFYDMPGYAFGPPNGVEFIEPSEAFKTALLTRLEAGGPCLFMHHALAGWPTWQTYGEVVGGRFLYRPGVVRGEQKLDSGYRHEATYKVTLANHEICTDLHPFEVTDELYLAEIFEDDILPLAWSDYSFDREHFYSASNAVNGDMYSREDWPHAPGSNLVAWLNSYEKAPIGYLQMGDGPSAYGNSAVTQLLTNMTTWLLSDAARTWAEGRNQ